jgi:BirA family biotin operon repressor/biotin-[acetyl-CoA-carboxylase] ligase
MDIDIDVDALKKSLAGKLIGHNIFYHSQTKSTNDEAFLLGLAGAADGTVVIADSQSKGKGRLQRSWHSPRGTNIYTSIILRPEIELRKASRIPIFAGVAVAEVLNQYCPGRIKLKWPNDVLLDGKKVSGILSQLKTSENKVDFIVLGIGINVNTDSGQFPQELQDTATSMFIKTGSRISRQELIISLYENLGKWYRNLMEAGFESIKDKWLAMSDMIDRRVEISFLGETVSGKVKGLDDAGSLILMDDRNEEIMITAGDAIILKR